MQKIEGRDANEASTKEHRKKFAAQMNPRVDGAAKKLAAKRPETFRNDS